MRRRRRPEQRWAKKEVERAQQQLQEAQAKQVELDKAAADAKTDFEKKRNNYQQLFFKQGAAGPTSQGGL